MKDGNILISVHTDESEEVTRAKEIFKASGATDISSTSESSAPKPTVRPGQTTRSY